MTLIPLCDVRLSGRRGYSLYKARFAIPFTISTQCWHAKVRIQMLSTVLTYSVSLFCLPVSLKSQSPIPRKQKSLIILVLTHLLDNLGLLYRRLVLSARLSLSGGSGRAVGLSCLFGAEGNVQRGSGLHRLFVLSQKLLDGFRGGALAIFVFIGG